MKYILMQQLMKVNLKIINLMDMEGMYGQMEKAMMVNGSMDKSMALVFGKEYKGIHIWVNGKMEMQME